MKKAIVISILILLPIFVFRYINAQRRKEEELYRKGKEEIVRKLQTYYSYGGGGGFLNLAEDMTGLTGEERTNILIRKVIFEKLSIENGMAGNTKIPNEIWIKVRNDLTEKVK